MPEDAGAVTATSRSEFLAQLGLQESDLQLPEGLKADAEDTTGVNDSIIRSTPLYDTKLLEDLKAEQSIGEGNKEGVDGVDANGRAYLAAELEKFRQSKTHAYASQDCGIADPAEEEEEAAPAPPQPPADTPEKIALTTNPNYEQMGHDSGQARSYKDGLLSQFRRRREEGVASPRRAEDGDAGNA